MKSTKLIIVKLKSPFSLDLYKDITNKLEKNNKAITISHKVDNRWRNEYLDLQYVLPFKKVFKYPLEENFLNCRYIKNNFL